MQTWRVHPCTEDERRAQPEKEGRRSIAGQLAVVVRVERQAHTATRERVEAGTVAGAVGIAGFAKRENAWARPAKSGKCGQRRWILQRQVRFGLRDSSRFRRRRVARKRGGWQQTADGRSMHVSSTCGADRMESLKDRKAGPGGVRRASRQEVQGIGSRAL